VTRRDQIDAVADVAGITAAQARLALDAVGALIAIALLEQEPKITIAGAGTFTIRHRRPRTIRNPATGVMMDLPASAVVKFRPTPDLRKAVEERHA
jgi:nucleoid DNA-binding protein